MKSFLKRLESFTLPLWAAIIGTVLILVWFGFVYLRYIANTYPYPFSDRPDPTELAVVSSVDSSACCLCGSHSYESPCLFNTSTGEIYQLTLFPSSQINNFAIDPLAMQGTYGYAMTGGNQLYSIFSIPDDGYSYLTFYVNQFKSYDPNEACKYVCQNCLNQINNLNPHSQLILCDMYLSNQNTIHMHDILPNRTITIRHYSIILDKVDSYNKISGYIKHTS